MNTNESQVKCYQINNNLEIILIVLNCSWRNLKNISMKTPLQLLTCPRCVCILHHIDLLQSIMNKKCLCILLLPHL